MSRLVQRLDPRPALGMRKCPVVLTPLGVDFDQSSQYRAEFAAQAVRLPELPMVELRAVAEREPLEKVRGEEIGRLAQALGRRAFRRERAKAGDVELETGASPQGNCVARGFDPFLADRAAQARERAAQGSSRPIGLESRPQKLAEGVAGEAPLGEREIREQGEGLARVEAHRLAAPLHARGAKQSDVDRHGRNDTRPRSRFVTVSGRPCRRTGDMSLSQSRSSQRPDRRGSEMLNAKRSLRPLVLCLFLSIAALAPTTASAANLSSPFNASNEGWQVVNNNAANPSTPVNPTFNATGGNPGGHISVTDAAADPTATTNGHYYQLVAPASWRTNLFSNYGGTLSLDFNESGGTFGPVIYIHRTADLYLVVGFAPRSGWGRYSVPLKEAEYWGLVEPSHPEYAVTPTRGDFQYILSSVSAIKIEGDSVAGTGDIGRFDNIEVKESPDSDGDGVRDYADNCPSQAGAPSNGGCPPTPPPVDSDGDEVADPSDNCPATSGPASNGGCPEPVVSPPTAGGEPIPAPTAGDSKACTDARAMLAKAKRALKKAKEAVDDAKGKSQRAKAEEQLAKAKRKLKKAKAAVDEACV